MACIGGILLWVSTNMVKVAEIREVCTQGRLNIFLMVFTAIMVPLTDFLTGVLSALVIYMVSRFFHRARSGQTALSGTAAQEAEKLLDRFRELGAQRELQEAISPDFHQQETNLQK